MSYLLSKINIAHLVAPIDANNVTKTTDELNFKNYNHITFLVGFGVIGAADALITIEKCTNAAGGSNTAIGFNYRVTGAAGGASEDTWGALTAVANTGLVVATASDDGKLYAIEIDAAECGTAYPFVRCIVDPGAVATLVFVVGIGSEPRYETGVMTSMIT